MEALEAVELTRDYLRALAAMEADDDTAAIGQTLLLMRRVRGMTGHPARAAALVACLASFSAAIAYQAGGGRDGAEDLLDACAVGLMGAP
ncbi:hypothetical protein EBN88_05460 [Streptomyces triticirhizae]|uniref:Uncharacterized protein n=2 Tax=Streptomyces triticirhizae TaxID=2483353 RepID=A0A3M2M4B8_9ACTN|nr:hypothetical protein EBN88_05460 [Streptomyces triticirhizae]